MEIYVNYKSVNTLGMSVLSKDLSMWDDYGVWGTKNGTREDIRIEKGMKETAHTKVAQNFNKMTNG